MGTSYRCIMDDRCREPVELRSFPVFDSAKERRERFGNDLYRGLCSFDIQRYLDLVFIDVILV